ncbi:FYVE, RhoGEF and PH domain-containing protein 1-like [Gigantopelta aegis]|uniref:FYVE, RhoGEF and PH domain-containing protein 1-like n=1 Tax=Gigantopelta aegis TaxID=1735272 RepID=UPI001B888242|nr:FYVE, RhoGEF and PH domain-containing protein 1-like [Gigantopelta aegis]
MPLTGNKYPGNIKEKPERDREDRDPETDRGVDSQLEHLVDYVTERLKSSTKTPDVPRERRVHYSKHRTRCGAPSVNRRSFSEEEWDKFLRENDGFPLPSTDDEVKHFDEEVFVGSEVPRVEIMPSPRCQRSRSSSVPEFRSMSSSCAALKAKLQKLPAPSKPKFFEKLITGVGLSRRADDKETRHDLIPRGDRYFPTEENATQTSAADDGYSVGLNPQYRAGGVLQLEGAEGLHTASCDSDDLDFPDDECSSPEGTVTPTNTSPSHRSPTTPPFRRTWCTPTSPLISGFVKQQCVNFHKLCSETQENVLLCRQTSKSKTAYTQSAPTSPCIESKSFCTYYSQRHRIDRCNQVFKTCYNVSREGRLVMSKGYVKTLVEQMDSSKFKKNEDNVKNLENASPVVVKDKKDPDNGVHSSVGQSSRQQTSSPSAGMSRTLKPKPAFDRSKKPNLNKIKNKTVDVEQSSSAIQIQKNGNAGLDKLEINNSSSEVDSGFGLSDGPGPSPLSPAELFDSSWSDSDKSFDDFSESDIDMEYQRALKVEDLEIAPPDVVPTPTVDDNKPLDKQYRIADELFRTEKDYVSRLHLVHQVFHFKITMRNRQENFIPDEVITKMFLSIESIYQFHHDFLLPQLEDRMKNWSSKPYIGDLMKKNAPFLKLYTDYVKNFDCSMNLINTWQQKSKKFTAIINEIQKEPECGSLTLQHHMLEPIQRVPRYEMLLKDYIKHIPQDSQDHRDSKVALELVTTATKHSSEAMRKIEKFKKLLEIHQRLRGIHVDFINPTRELLCEGPVTKISARSGEKQIRYLFLFNDMLLICSELLLKTYKVRSQLDIDGMKMKSGENPNSFCVESKQKVIEMLDLENQAGEKSNWKESINQAILDLEYKKQLLKSRKELTQNSEPLPSDSWLGTRAPQWVADDQATYCMVCDKGFSTLRRRHHCRACGWVICNKCCRSAPLAYLDNKLDRVCTKCYSVLVHASEDNESSHKGTTKPGNGILQVEAEDAAVLSGYLSMSPDKGRTWMKRWFSVHEDFVMYSFKGNKDKSALSSLPLPGYIAEKASAKDTDKSYVFKLKHKDKTVFLFQTDNEKHMKRWISVLEKLVQLEIPEDGKRFSSQSGASNSSSTDTTDDSNDLDNTGTGVGDGNPANLHVADGNKLGQDSDITMADSAGSVAGSVAGNVTENVAGSVAGNVAGSVAGSVPGSVAGNVNSDAQKSSQA